MIRSGSREGFMEDYQKLNGLLSSVTEKIEKDNLEDISSQLSDMRKLAKVIGGRVLERFEVLEEDISKKLDKKVLLEDCLNLKNELFEL